MPPAHVCPCTYMMVAIARMAYFAASCFGAACTACHPAPCERRGSLVRLAMLLSELALVAASCTTQPYIALHSLPEL